MNLVCLFRHLKNAWLYRTNLTSFVVQFVWRYSHNLPKWLFPGSKIIYFRYPKPVGNIAFKVRNNASDVFIFEGTFTDSSYNLGLTLEPKTILDLGANAGFTTVYFSRLYPQAQIACVEPMPQNIEMLRANLELNRVHAQIFSAAIAIEDGSILMEIAERDYSHSVVGLKDSSKKFLKQIQVPAVTIPTICNKLGWQSIDFLKMDIEGYEKILFSADCSWLKQVKIMCIEWHGPFAKEQVLDLARQHGFNDPRYFPGTWLLERPS